MNCKKFAGVYALFRKKRTGIIAITECTFSMTIEPQFHFCFTCRFFSVPAMSPQIYFFLWEKRKRQPEKYPVSNRPCRRYDKVCLVFLFEEKPQHTPFEIPFLRIASRVIISHILQQRCIHFLDIRLGFPKIPVTIIV